MTIGKVFYQIIYIIDFLIVDHPSAYNIILSRPFLAATKAAVSMHYLAMNIPIAEEVITITDDQQSIYGCYYIVSKASDLIITDATLKGYPTSSMTKVHLTK